MIKVSSIITPMDNGIDLDSTIIVAVPKGCPKDVADIICTHEIKALLKQMYKTDPDIVEDAIQEFVKEETEDDKTDINNN